MRKKYNYKQLEIKLLIKYYTVLNSIMVNLFNHFFVSILPHLIQSNVSTFEHGITICKKLGYYGGAFCPEISISFNPLMHNVPK